MARVPFPCTRPTNDNDVKVYIHGGECWLPRYDIPKNADKVEKYKVIIPRSGNPGGSILGRPKLSEPNSCGSNTYVVFLPTDHDMTLNEANNVITYLKTRFVRYLIATKTSTQDMPPRAYGFVPVQDFLRPGMMSLYTRSTHWLTKKLLQLKN